MIITTKIIETENAIDEIWKNLRYFSHVPSIFAYLTQLNGGIENKNIRKQSEQVSLCIRQAQEYFEASNAVSLSTKPLLLYYGAVSLGNALVLVRNNGSSSIDYLRKHKKHKHHGLEMLNSIEQLKSNLSVKEILELITCKCHFKKEIDENNTKTLVPWGNFPLFYNSLVQSAFSYNGEEYDSRYPESYTMLNLVQATSEKQPLMSFVRKEFNLLELIQNIPDLNSDLIHLGIPLKLHKGSAKEKMKKTYNPDGSFNKISFEYEFFINNVNQNDKDSFTNILTDRINDIRIIPSGTTYLHLKCSYETIGDINADLPLNYFPDIVDDLKGNLYYIIDPDNHLQEPSSYLIALYQLGMLVRYYPDLWIKLIDTNTLFSELIKSLVSSFYRKFPNLILDQLTLQKHIFTK